MHPRLSKLIIRLPTRRNRHSQHRATEAKTRNMHNAHNILAVKGGTAKHCKKSQSCRNGKSPSNPAANQSNIEEQRTRRSQSPAMNSKRSAMRQYLRWTAQRDNYVSRILNHVQHLNSASAGIELFKLLPQDVQRGSKPKALRVWYSWVQAFPISSLGVWVSVSDSLTDRWVSSKWLTEAIYLVRDSVQGVNHSAAVRNMGPH